MRIHKYIAALILYQVSSMFVNIHKLIYVPVEVSNIVILRLSPKLVNLVFLMFPSLVTKLSTSFLPNTTQVIFVEFTWFLQPM
jgi:hypothetical protein